MTYESPWMDEGTRALREKARRFIQEEFVPHEPRWRKQRRPDAEAWTKAGAAGLLLTDVPKEYGGGGGTLAHEAVVAEELIHAGINFGVMIQSIVAHYILAYGNEEQKKRLLPRLARGERVGGIAMTEAGAGSDLQAIKTTAVREGSHFVLNGAKAFVTNGWHCGVLVMAVKTDPRVPGSRGISLLVVEPKGLPGCGVSEPLEKIGMHAQDACDLTFDGVRVPASALLGDREGMGFPQMMAQLPYERLLIALNAVSASERAVRLTTKHAKERMAFGAPLIELQNTRFELAECKTQAHVGRVFIDRCIQDHIAGRLDGATTAMAKYWLTDCEGRIVDRCVQLHGGVGYMNENPVARLWADSRVHRIYGGANEIMKEIIGQSL